MGQNESARLAELEAALLELRQQAAGNAVVVEGPHDLAALEELGVGGEHIMFHRGVSVEVFIDQLAERARQAPWQKILLLLDWDRTGGRIFRRLHQGLKARFPVDAQCRRALARASHVKCVEHVPSDLAALRRRV